MISGMGFGNPLHQKVPNVENKEEVLMSESVVGELENKDSGEIDCVNCEKCEKSFNNRDGKIQFLAVIMEKYSFRESDKYNEFKRRMILNIPDNYFTLKNIEKILSRIETNDDMNKFVNLLEGQSKDEELNFVDVFQNFIDDSDFVIDSYSDEKRDDKSLEEIEIVNGIENEAREKDLRSEFTEEFKRNKTVGVLMKYYKEFGYNIYGLDGVADMMGSINGYSKSFDEYPILDFLHKIRELGGQEGINKYFDIASTRNEDILADGIDPALKEFMNPKKEEK